MAVLHNISCCTAVDKLPSMVRWEFKTATGREREEKEKRQRRDGNDGNGW
jgi:hypothetical protein